MGVCFMGVYLTGVHVTGVCLMGVYVTGVHLIGMCLMGVHLTGVHLMVSSASAHPTIASASTLSSVSSVASTSSSPTQPSPTPGSPIPDVSNDACAACELSLYFLGVQGLAAECNFTVPIGVGYDISDLLYDSTLYGRYASFCNYLCANPCVTYNTQKWIQSTESQFWSNTTLALCAQECPGFKGDGRCQIADTCPCTQGLKACEAC
jgi:hypothetical protein